MVDDARLAEIAARAEAATPGPWHVTERREDVYVANEGRGYPGAVLDGVRAVDDAEFIAHAREDVPALLARVRELEAVGEAARKVACKACGYRIDDSIGDFDEPEECLTCRPLRSALAALGVSSAASGSEASDG